MPRFTAAVPDVKPAHRVEYLSMAISLVASTHGVALLPDFARNFPTWSVTSRPLAGEAPSIDLVLGYYKANNSPLLQTFLSREECLKKRRVVGLVVTQDQVNRRRFAGQRTAGDRPRREISGKVGQQRHPMS